LDNLIKHINQNCEDKSVEGIVKFLFKSGDLNFKSEQDREIWFFYLEALDMLKVPKPARDTTLELFGITWRQFNYIRKMFQQ